MQLFARPLGDRQRGGASAGWLPSPRGCARPCWAWARSPTGRAAMGRQDRFRAPAWREILLLRYRASRYLSAIAPELLAQAVGEPVTLRAKLACDARPLAQFDDGWVEGGQQPQAMRIGAQGRRHHFGVAAIVFGSCQREAVPEAIHLFRIDGVNHKAALDQRLHHGSVRRFEWRTIAVQSCLLPASNCEPPQPSPVPVLALGKKDTSPARTPHEASITASLAGRTSNLGDRSSSRDREKVGASIRCEDFRQFLTFKVATPRNERFPLSARPALAILAWNK